MAIIIIQKGDRNIQPLLDRAKVGDLVILDSGVFDNWTEWKQVPEIPRSVIMEKLSESENNTIKARGWVKL